MEYAYHIFLLLGGIGLFLYGINYMSQSLYEALGENLKTILEKLTTNPFKAVLLGVAVTAIIQSSGATMVMVVGFIAAQLMTLAQGMYVMVGAAIGTTITAQIIAFKIDPWAPLIMFVGAMMYLFIKKRRALHRIGAIILGFGTLFTGIYLMGEAIQRMSLGRVIGAFLERVDNPLLSLLFGFVFTFIIQSSSASVGILQVLLSGTALAEFDLASVTFMIMGMNVGAVAPVVLSGLAGNHSSKRAALASAIIKLISVVLFSVIMLIWPGCVDLIAGVSGSVSRQIANFHLIYNVVTTVCIFPLLKPIANTIMKYMPDDPEDTKYSRKTLYIAKGQDIAPSVMISQCRQEIYRFADLVKNNYEKSMRAFFNQDIEEAMEVKEHEDTINYLNLEIYNYLVNLHGKLLPQRDVETLARMFSILTDLERIGDHAENIAEYTVVAKEHNATVSRKAWAELQEMGWKTVAIVNDAVEAYKTRDFRLLGRVQMEEDIIDDLKLKLENNHIERVRHQECDPRGGTLFIDIIVDYERVSDHALNVAETILSTMPMEKISSL